MLSCLPLPPKANTNPAIAASMIIPPSTQAQAGTRGRLSTDCPDGVAGVESGVAPALSDGAVAAAAGLAPAQPRPLIPAGLLGRRADSPSAGASVPRGVNAGTGTLAPLTRSRNACASPLPAPWPANAPPPSWPHSTPWPPWPVLPRHATGPPPPNSAASRTPPVVEHPGRSARTTSRERSGSATRARGPAPCPAPWPHPLARPAARHRGTWRPAVVGAHHLHGRLPTEEHLAGQHLEHDAA